MDAEVEDGLCLVLLGEGCYGLQADLRMGYYPYLKEWLVAKHSCLVATDGDQRCGRAGEGAAVAAVAAVAAAAGRAKNLSDDYKKCKHCAGMADSVSSEVSTAQQLAPSLVCA